MNLETSRLRGWYHDKTASKRGSGTEKRLLFCVKVAASVKHKKPNQQADSPRAPERGLSCMFIIRAQGKSAVGINRVVPSLSLCLFLNYPPYDITPVAQTSIAISSLETQTLNFSSAQPIGQSTHRPSFFL